MRAMSSGSMAAWRSASELPDRDDGAPDWQTIRKSQHTSRKNIQCACGDWMPPGTRYGQEIALEDGKFVVLRHCLPGQCHAIGERRRSPDDREW